jgi:hypothetical protein
VTAWRDVAGCNALEHVIHVLKEVSEARIVFNHVRKVEHCLGERASSALVHQADHVLGLCHHSPLVHQLQTVSIRRRRQDRPASWLTKMWASAPPPSTTTAGLQQNSTNFNQKTKQTKQPNNQTTTQQQKRQKTTTPKKTKKTTKTCSVHEGLKENQRRCSVTNCKVQMGTTDHLQRLGIFRRDDGGHVSDRGAHLVLQ